MKRVLIFSLLLFSATNSWTQTPDFRKLDSFFNALEKQGLANGSLAISINGTTTYQRSAGFSVLDSQHRMKPDQNTVYRVGSVSKMFTAVMIFQLIEEGMLHPEQLLGSFFPNLPNATRITISQLLQHRSGLPDYSSDPAFSEWMDKPQTQSQLLARIAALPPLFEPDSKSSYCNSNYLLLGYIIEQLTGQDYASALKGRVVDRLGLQHTMYGHPIRAGNNEALSYKYNDGSWMKQKETNMGIHGGAGSVMSTATDLVLFIEGLFNGKLLRVQSVNEMMTMKEEYGKGLFRYDYEFVKAFGHNGRIEEFYSAVRYYPETRLAFAYITNGILYPRQDILDAVLQSCFNDPFEIPFTAPMADPAQLQKYAGVYASPDLPFKVSCAVKDKTLLVEAAGRSMTLAQVSTGYFMDRKSGTFFKFDPAGSTLQVKETDNVYLLKKE